MGDRDTKEVSVRLATEEAKRDALEQAATYLESVTVVEDRAVTRDEINTYTAGLVVVLDQQTSMTLDGDTVVVTVALTAEVDTEEVAQALTVLREQKDARHQLDALRLENDGLRRDLVEIHRMLEQASTFDQTQQISQQRQDILNRAQSNALVSQAWTDWVLTGPASFPAGRAGGIGAAHTLALLNAAQGCPQIVRMFSGQRGRSRSSNRPLHPRCRLPRTKPPAPPCRVRRLRHSTRSLALHRLPVRLPPDPSDQLKAAEAFRCPPLEHSWQFQRISGPASRPGRFEPFASSCNRRRPNDCLR